MKTKHYILLLAALFAYCNLYAQPPGMKVGLANTQMVYYPYDIAQLDTLDTTMLTVGYIYSYYYEDIKEGSTPIEDIMTLQVGESYTKFFSRNYHLMERNIAFREKNDVKFKQNYVGYEIYRDKGQSKYIVTQRLPFVSRMDNEAIRYEEKIPNIKWEVEEQSTTLLGYNCIKATAKVYGREWSVWFTPEIPVSYGPWKLQGLPGLILSAEDSEGEYSFTANEITQEKQPIEMYGWRYKDMSKKKWLKYEKGMYEHPYFIFTKGGENPLFNVHTKQDMDESWTIPYNPIEL